MKTAAAEEIRESIAELEKQTDRLKSQVASVTFKLAHLKIEAAKLTEPERIRVPENIKFRANGDSFKLISPNGKCEMSMYNAHGGIPLVVYAGRIEDPTDGIITDPLYLKKCKREDLKYGDWAVAFDNAGIENAKESHSYYACILNDREQVSWSGEMGTRVSNISSVYWYKVVR